VLEAVLFVVILTDTASLAPDESHKFMTVLLTDYYFQLLETNLAFDPSLQQTRYWPYPNDLSSVLLAPMNLIISLLVVPAKCSLGL